MRLGEISGGASFAAVMVLASPVAEGQTSEARAYDMPAQALGAALRQVTVVSGRPVVAATDLVAGRQAPALKGRFSAEDAVAELLRGSGLRAVPVAGALVVERDPAPAGSADAGAPDDILVTGSRIRGHGPVGSPVITIDRAAIDQNGFATTQQIAQSIPQNFAGGANESTANAITGLGNGNGSFGSGINLRGLGQTSTLVLLNGDRPPLGGAEGTFSDLSMIPASAIERVEIVPDGASAIYGADAVAGVVNIIPRLDFTGAETSFRTGTADGDSQEYQASQLLGTKWASGHAMIAYEFYRRARLRAADRAFATDDLRRFGAADYRGLYASPGTIYEGGKSFAIPAGQNGVGLPAASLVPGTVNLGDSQVGTDILPDQRRHSLFAAVSQELGGGVRVYAHGLVSIRSFDAAIRTNTNTTATIPVTNPFYVDPLGTHQPVTVRYSFVGDLGNERSQGKVSAYGGTAGVEGKLGAWSLDAHGTWGRQAEHYADVNAVNTARLGVALARSDAATAYNLFGVAGSTSRATIDSIRGSTVSNYDGTAWSLTARAEGPLLALPAGAIRLAAGGEYHSDVYHNQGLVSDISTLTPTFRAGTPLPGIRTVKAGYAELLLPVFGGSATLSGFHRLDLSVAVRAERYSDFGGTTNPKFGANWEPIAGLTLRGSYGKSFRAPGDDELRQDPGSMAIFAFNIPDPKSPTGSSNVIVIRGNDPQLRPERATTWTLGADLKPAFLPGLHAGVTWYNVDYRDRIATPASQLFSFLTSRSVYAPLITDNPSPARVAELFASPIYKDFTGIPATAAFAAVVDARTQNLSVVKQSGLDLDLEYGFGLAGGHAEFGAVATHIFYIRQALTATAPAANVLDTVGNPVDLRLRGHATWTSDTLSAALFVNYVGGYSNRTNAVSQRVSSWTTADLNIGYRFRRDGGILKGLRIALDTINLFDRDPPFVAYYTGVTATGFDAENANPLGRVISLQITKSW